MKYRYIKNLREKKTTKADDLSKIEKEKPEFKSKALYREWCADAETEHVFFNMCEGDNPSLRVSSENPVNAVHGVVADYDAPVDWEAVDKLIQAQCKEFAPTWRTKTQSGYIRLVWEFENRMPISADMYDAFIKRISNHIGVERIFAGFDSSSFKAGQYFEIGQDWVKTGEPLPKSVYRTSLLKAASDKPPQSTETSVPIDVIEKEVRERFPNRWEGDFVVGARGPLFWIDDGVEREGCQVSEEGIVCYSDRAGKGFVTWKEIFGAKFIEEFETQKMGDLLDNYWFNGKSHFKLLYGTAQMIPKDQLVLELRRAGFSPRPRRGQSLSEVEMALLTIANENRIDEIAPVIFSKDRVVTYNSHRILNNANIEPVLPAEDGDPAHWPFLHKWLNQLFANSKEHDTVLYFYAWLKRFYTAVLEREKAQGQALLLVGPTNKGKSLLSNRVISALVGGFADASDYLSGQTKFNKDLARVAAWVIDDTTSAASFQDQRRATELVKKSVANPRIEYHAKYVDAVSVPWTGRVIFSLNMDANSLSVIPSLDSSNRDKLMALRVSNKATSKFPSNTVVEEVIEKELPHFARFLLDWEAPAEVKGASRFGVVSYIDKSIASAAYDNSSRSTVAELVEFFVKRAREYYNVPVWRGTLTEFQGSVHEFNGGRSIGVSSNLEFVRRGFLVLEEASRNSKEARPVKSIGSGGGKIWEIDLDSKFDIDRDVETPQQVFVK
tara:strand:- start:4622 stop:6793 length:2172 start_codon:yes stop_codon:yes gene_type:complete